MTSRPNIETIRSRLAAAVAASERSVSDIETSAGLKDSVNLVSAASIAIELGTSLEWLADMPQRTDGSAQ
jgi:hypothetical protein